MTTAFENGGQFQQWMSLGQNDEGFWWAQYPGRGWGVYSDPLYTNGPADDSLPSSLSSSSTSGETGIWFRSLWWGDNATTAGSEFTVSQKQDGSTMYLKPVTDSSGAFEGWKWSSTAYDFTQQNAESYFSMGGLKDGTYTVTEASPATSPQKATASNPPLSFPVTLVYSSAEAFTSKDDSVPITDPLNLLDAPDRIVYNVITPTSLPFTGGKWVLGLSITAILLFGAGGAFYFLRKRKRA